MKQEISTPMIVVAAAGMLLVVVLIGWWTMRFAGKSADANAINKRVAEKKARGQ